MATQLNTLIHDSVGTLHQFIQWLSQSDSIDASLLDSMEAVKQAHVLLQSKLNEHTYAFDESRSHTPPPKRRPSSPPPVERKRTHRSK